jgi:hypothetical protein
MQTKKDNNDEEEDGDSEEKPACQGSAIPRTQTSRFL